MGPAAGTATIRARPLKTKAAQQSAGRARCVVIDLSVSEKTHLRRIPNAPDARLIPFELILSVSISPT